MVYNITNSNNQPFNGENEKKQIGNFKIDISDGDIYNGDFVELTVSRIDTV